jgi:rare lipoprotein A
VTSGTVAGAVCGGLTVVAFAAFWLWWMPPAHAAERICGVASYYGTESGSRTATGERFTGRDLTAAMPSRTHLGERWRVKANGKSVVVRVNDYGPAKRLHRVVDLSKAAFARLAPLQRGTLHICMERL